MEKAPISRYDYSTLELFCFVKQDINLFPSHTTKDTATEGKSHFLHCHDFRSYNAGVKVLFVHAQTLFILKFRTAMASPKGLQHTVARGAHCPIARYQPKRTVDHEGHHT